MQNRLIKPCLAIVATITLLSSCKLKAHQEENFQNSLDLYFRSTIKSDGPGIAIIVAKPNKDILFAMGYGVEDINTKAPITSKTLFNLGSVSKTFVGFAILKLQEQGKLSIEDPIFKYFPNFKDSNLVKDIKIKHLLSHTSGLPDNRPVDKDSVFFLTANDEQNFAPILQNDSLLFQPGERFEYSNPAFNGLALIVEKVSGQKWQQYIKENIFNPSGMATSVITDGAFPDKGVSHGYQQVNGKWQEYDFGEYPTFCASGNGGVWSSVEELLLYEEAIQKNKFVSDSTVKLARRVFIPSNWKDTIPPNIGFDWFTETFEGLKAIGHTGDQGGFRADYFYYPEKKIFIGMISNGSHDLGKVRKKVLELMKGLE